MVRFGGKWPSKQDFFIFKLKKERKIKKKENIKLVNLRRI